MKPAVCNVGTARSLAGLCAAALLLLQASSSLAGDDPVRSSCERGISGGPASRPDCGLSPSSGKFQHGPASRINASSQKPPSVFKPSHEASSSESGKEQRPASLEPKSDVKPSEAPSGDVEPKWTTPEKGQEPSWGVCGKEPESKRQASIELEGMLESLRGIDL